MGNTWSNSQRYPSRNELYKYKYIFQENSQLEISGDFLQKFKKKVKREITFTIPRIIPVEVPLGCTGGIARQTPEKSIEAAQCI